MDDEVDLNAIQNVSSMWRYRARVSVDHLIHEFSENMAAAVAGAGAAGDGESAYQQQPVLRVFLESEQYLRLLHLLPSVLRLQRRLIALYNRRIDHIEATNYKIADLLNREFLPGKSVPY